MVGVPRSKGCSTCRTRRIKCDEARPECGQCRKYGCPCPGYNRGLKFQDEGPSLQRRHRRRTISNRKDDHDGETNSSSESGSSKSMTKADFRAMFPEIGADEALLMMQMHANSIDENLSPSLIQKLFMSQQPRLFMDFVCAAFPTLYFHNRFRSNVAFPEYIMENYRSKAYRYSTVCCLSAVYLASLTKDDRLLRSSRYMYGEALHRINRIIETEEALSDDVLSTVMMLTLYELYARTTPDAWVKHARGVRKMMMKRGVEKHRSGFGRSCYYAFRGFLVAHALHEGIPCFLDDDEWQNFAAQVQKEDAKKPGEWSVFVHISEMIFMELVKCPRYIYNVRQLSPKTPRSEISILVTQIRATCANLRSLSDELRASIMFHFQKKKGVKVNADGFVGPAPSFFPDTNPTLLLQGATHCINTLEKLLDTIFINKSALQQQPAAITESLTLPAQLTPPQSQSSLSPRLPPAPATLLYHHQQSAAAPHIQESAPPAYLPPTPSADSTCESIFTEASSPSLATDLITSRDNNSQSRSLTLPFRLVSEIGRGPAHHGEPGASHRSVVWLDHVACSMGMIGADVEPEKFSEDAEFNDDDDDDDHHNHWETVPETTNVAGN